MKCKYCNSEQFTEKLVPPHIGIYCNNCGRWQKWRKATGFEKVNFDKLQKIIETPRDIKVEMPLRKGPISVTVNTTSDERTEVFLQSLPWHTDYNEQE